MVTLKLGSLRGVLWKMSTFLTNYMAEKSAQLNTISLKAHYLFRVKKCEKIKIFLVLKEWL